MISCSPCDSSILNMPTVQVMAPNRKIFALKRIRLTGRDAEAASGFIDEIRLLQSLRSQPNIIQLIDAEVSLATQACLILLGDGRHHTNNDSPLQVPAACSVADRMPLQRLLCAQIVNVHPAQRRCSTCHPL